MKETYSCNKNELTQSRITFWFYAVSTPIIIVIFIINNIKDGVFQINPFSLVYAAIVIGLAYCGYRAFRVMNATANSQCTVTDERVSGISTPTPYKKGIPFDIAREEILGIGKTTVTVGFMRAYNALAINTQKDKIILLAIDRMDELKAELQKETNA